MHNGQGAIDYLSGQGPCAERDAYWVPGVVLLDLHLPGVSGFDVFEGGSGRTRSIGPCRWSSFLPPCTKTTGRARQPWGRTTKPSSAISFKQVARTLHQRWLQIEAAAD